MAFLNLLLDPKISLGAEGGPTFETSIVVMESGNESRNAIRSKELGSWDIGYAARLPAVYKPLQAFFRIARGQANTWRFFDHSDFEVGFGGGPTGVFTQLTTTTFQMWARYTYGAYSFDAKVLLPVKGTVHITGGVSPTLDYTTPSGIVTVASGTPTSFTAQRHKLARFGTDEMRQKALDRQGSELIIEWAGIPVKEVPA